MTLLDPGDPAGLADHARAGLRSTFDVDATLVARAPGRVNLIGEHTDYNRGLVLPVALPHATYAAATPRTDRQIRLASDQADDVVTGTIADFGPGDVDGWAAYSGGVLWALRENGLDLAGMDLFITSTVPLGAGLSSSAAIECSVAMAAVTAAGLTVDDDLRQLIVQACIRAETEVAGAPTGGMDQTVSVFAEAETALLIDFDDGKHSSVPLALRDRTLLVTDTQVSHQLTDGGYASRRDSCEKAAEILGISSLRQASLADLDQIGDDVTTRRARHIVTEIARVPEVVASLGSGDWSETGRLFAASHASMRDDFEISTPELDLSVATAVAAGADAARMTGGGFGGSTVAIVRNDTLDHVTDAIDAAFAEAGYGAPAHLVATPSAGAAVV